MWHREATSDSLRHRVQAAFPLSMLKACASSVCVIDLLLYKSRILSRSVPRSHFSCINPSSKLCGRSYCKEYLDYIFVNEMGERWKPRYLSDGFKRILEQNGLRRIRFHDLRHTCASLLLANNVPMKKIQEWLGHSKFSTTANIYAHLDYQSKISSAEAMLTGLSMS